MAFEVLVDFNPWWAKGVVPEIFLGKFKRPVLGTIKAFLDKRFIVLLYGLRRVGKTTAFYQTIHYLLQSGVKPENILYFSFDEKKAEIHEIISSFEEKVLKKRIIDCKEKVFVFFDEIQKINDWQNKIKVLYDLHPNAKIFLSGSATVSLQKKATESLAGRIIDVFVQPLSFSEFLDWKGVKADKEPQLLQKQISPLLIDYLRKGGFPEIIDEEKDELIRNYIKNTVIEKILYKDISQEFRLKDLELLKLLLEMFIKEPGMIINVEKLSRDLGKNKLTISNYIEYLQYSLLVRKVKNLRSGMLVSSRKGKKIYPSNTAFCFAYQNDFYSEKNLEKIAEVSVASHILAEYYYRNSFEIDFVSKKNNVIIPIEVKYGGIEFHQVKKFIEKFRAEKSIIVSKNVFSEEKNKITIMPLWLFLLKEF